MNVAGGTHQWLLSLAADERMRVPKGLAIGKGVSQATLISESGLYKIIMRSDKPQAKPFQDYVTKEVLPSIRKTGSFVTGQPSLVENPQMSNMEATIYRGSSPP